MKKELYILSLLCFLSLTIFAQEKVKIGGDTYYYKNFSVSAYPELDNIIDIQSNFIIEKDVPIAVDNLKKSFFQIKGFLKSKDGATPLSIETTISQPYLLDKAIIGKENNYNCLFTFGCTVKVVVAIKNKIIFNEVLKKSVTVLDRRYFLTKIDAQNRLEELVAKQELGDQEEEAIYETLKLIRKELENVIGYLPNQEYIRFFYLKNKDNSEYERIFAFRELVKKEMLSITPEKGINLTNFQSYITFFEFYLNKEPITKDDFEMRFLCSQNLANLYYLAEKKDLMLKYGKIALETHIKEGTSKELLQRIENFAPAENRLRKHSLKYVQINKLIEADGQLQKEIKDFEIQNNLERIEIEKLTIAEQNEQRKQWFDNHLTQRNNVLNAPNEQENAEILNLILTNLGTLDALKTVQKLQIKSSITLVGSLVPAFKEISCIDHQNFLQKNKSSNTNFLILNPQEAFMMDEKTGAKWATLPTWDYYTYAQQADVLYLLSSLDFANWANYQVKDEIIISENPCYHLLYLETELENNRPVPKKQKDIFIEKTSGKVLEIQIISFEDGKKISLEKTKNEDFRPVNGLLNAQIPFKITHYFEDYFGNHTAVENISMIAINPVISSRIFVKEVYSGGFK